MEEIIARRGRWERDLELALTQGIGRAPTTSPQKLVLTRYPAGPRDRDHASDVRVRQSAQSPRFRQRLFVLELTAVANVRARLREERSPIGGTDRDCGVWAWCYCAPPRGERQSFRRRCVG